MVSLVLRSFRLLWTIISGDGRRDGIINLSSSNSPSSNDQSKNFGSKICTINYLNFDGRKISNLHIEVLNTSTP